MQNVYTIVSYSLTQLYFDNFGSSGLSDGFLIILLLLAKWWFNWVQANVWRNESAAWPVANPVITCASVSNAGFPSNFVADPFLFVQVNSLLLLNFLFWRLKNILTFFMLQPFVVIHWIVLFISLQFYGPLIVRELVEECLFLCLSVGCRIHIYDLL